MQEIKTPIIPQLPQTTHKGEFGKVLVVGGSSEYYGAPILTALGAEHSGADLITLCLPYAHIETAKQYSLNFFLREFKEECLSDSDVENIIKFSKENHVMVIGNGLGKSDKTQSAILSLLEKISLPIILDAEALFSEVLKVKTAKQNWILTPHKKEFERLCNLPFSLENLKLKSEEYECTFLVKGHIDYIAHHGKIYENQTGCVQMRVGGTGDVLAGIIASYRAQGLNNLESAHSAAYYYGKTGEKLTHKQINFSAKNLIKFYPQSLLDEKP